MLVTPAAAGSRTGNRVTGERWARLLSELGHEVVVVESWSGEPCDVLIALHAKKSAPSVSRFRSRHPEAPVVVALTGTDVYADLSGSAEAAATLAAADRLVALQPLAAAELPPEQRAKVRVLFQSATAVDPAPPAPETVFSVCVLAHLREVKDPLCAARAARRLPEASRLVVWHAGGALEPALAEAARREAAENPRYHWLGELSRQAALALLAGCQALVVSSRLEGGANVVSEAIAAGVPVLASRIAGSIGILGEGYPGFFPTGDIEALAALLWRTESDPAFRDMLRAQCLGLRALVDPAREREGWQQLLAELLPPDRHDGP